LNDPFEEKSAFVLSCIYSQGWNAAKKMLAVGTGDMAASQAAATNPYRAGEAGEERERWMKGFTEALASPAGPFVGTGGHIRRALPARRISAAMGHGSE
jgi:hypothetical protein